MQFDAGCVAAVRAAAAISGYSARDMISRAGHDAAFVSRVAPAAMIFVPCKDGISHNEAEYSSKEQCAAGAQVLLQAVLDYDRQLAERSENKTFIRRPREGGTRRIGVRRLWIPACAGMSEAMPRCARAAPWRSAPSRRTPC